MTAAGSTVVVCGAGGSIASGGSELSRTCTGWPAAAVEVCPRRRLERHEQRDLRVGCQRRRLEPARGCRRWLQPHREQARDDAGRQIDPSERVVPGVGHDQDVADPGQPSRLVEARLPAGAVAESGLAAGDRRDGPGLHVHAAQAVVVGVGDDEALRDRRDPRAGAGAGPLRSIRRGLPTRTAPRRSRSRPRRLRARPGASTRSDELSASTKPSRRPSGARPEGWASSACTAGPSARPSRPVPATTPVRS